MKRLLPFVIVGSLAFSLGAYFGIAAERWQSDPPSDPAPSLSEWHSPCRFYIVAYAQILAAGGDADLRPDWQPADEFYKRWRIEDGVAYFETGTGKFGIEREWTGIRSTEGADCGTIRLEEKP